MKSIVRISLIVLITILLTLAILLPLLIYEFPGGSAVKKARDILDHNKTSKVDDENNKNNRE